MSVTVAISHDSVSPHLRALLELARPGGKIGNVLGRAAANELKKHFRTRNRKGNKLGGARTNFWSAVAASVSSTPTVARGGIAVKVAHPAIAQKVFGGTISPKKGKRLAIPIHALAHGRTARDVPGLFRVRSQAGNDLLVVKSGAGILPMFVLKKSVTQHADPQALPDDAKMGRALDKAAEILLRHPDAR